jgi:hypothetical protein
MLAFGYNAGLPAGTTTAWGCRAIVDWMTRSVDMLPDRQSAVGPRVDALLEHLNNQVRGAWLDRARELLRTGELNTRRANDLVLYHDGLVIIRGNTNGSAGYLYVCAYLLTEDDEG